MDYTITITITITNTLPGNVQVDLMVANTGDGFGATIPAGSTVTVGFQATVTGTPTVPGPISCDT